MYAYACVCACVCACVRDAACVRFPQRNDGDDSDDDFVVGTEKMRETRERERKGEKKKRQDKRKGEREKECDDGKVNLCPVAPSRNSILYSKVAQADAYTAEL